MTDETVLRVISRVDHELVSLGKTGRVFKGLDPLPLYERGKNKMLFRKITFTTTELTSYCPVTKQPDIYQIIIELYPLNESIETKSLKLYFESFRDTAIFAEDLAVKIAEDVFEACKPVQVVVMVSQNVRGGIQLSAEVVLDSLKGEDEF